MRRFDLAVSTDSVVSAGRRIRLNISVHANVTTREAEIRVVIPKLAMAQWIAAHPAAEVIGAELPSFRIWRTRLEASRDASYGVDVPVPVVGAYPVIITAAAPSGAPGIANRGWVQDVTHDVIWLVADSAGAHVASAPETERLAATTEPSPSATPNICTCTQCPTLPQCHPGQEPPSGFSVQALYYDQDSDSYLPIRDALVSYTTSIGGFGTTRTDQLGHYSLPCPGPGETTTAMVVLINADVNVAPGEIGRRTYDSDECITQTQHLMSDEARVFDNISKTAAASHTYFGRSRGRIVVSISSSVSNSFYSPDDDRITIKSAHVWGAFGVFTAAHEYGHALHEKALGGIVGNGQCPSTHFLDGAYNLGCAYTEGFADYHAVAVRGATTGQLSAIENDLYYPGGDGSIVEGAVAAFLLDLTDPVNLAESGKDNTAYPGSYVADIIRTCTVSPLGLRAGGIDQAIACMQHSSTSLWRTQGFFCQEALAVSGSVESATEPSGWNPSDIQRSWKWNLYHLPVNGTRTCA